MDGLLQGWELYTERDGVDHGLEAAALVAAGISLMCVAAWELLDSFEDEGGCSVPDRAKRRQQNNKTKVKPTQWLQ